MFEGCPKLVSVKKATRLESPWLTDMSYMFAECPSLVDVDISGWEFFQVESMHGMYMNCSSLRNFDMPVYSSSTGTDMGEMFENCISLERANLYVGGYWYPTDMSEMFKNCVLLDSVDMTSFILHEVETVSSLFSGCSSLVEISIPKSGAFDFKNTSKMFENCSALEYIDLSALGTKEVVVFDDMFSGCSSLTRVSVGKGWTLLGVIHSPERGSVASNGGFYTGFWSDWTGRGRYRDIPTLSEQTYIARTATFPCSHQWSGWIDEKPPTFEAEGLRYRYCWKCDEEEDETIPKKDPDYGLKDISEASVSTVPPQIYTGKAISPKPIVTFGSSTLREATDYKLSYHANTNVGTASVLIAGCGNYTGSKTITFEITVTTVSRLAGDTALDTMTSITRQGFSSCDMVIVATMGGYWDALAASALAGLSNCPILLTDGSTLSAQTASEIRRLKPSKIYVVGGEAAISSKVETSLKYLPGISTVKRLAGDIAVNTALEIYKQGNGSWSKTAVVATSETFQDALSISPYAYAKKTPIFLAKASTHKLDDQVVTAIKQGGFDRIVIVGGTAALSEQIEKQQLKGIDCIRLAGATAYETSGAIAEWCLTQGMTATDVGVATGDGYWDALAGAAFCGKNSSVLVLVSDSNRINVNGFIKSNRASVQHAYIFGGSAAVSDATRNAISAVLE